MYFLWKSAYGYENKFEYISEWYPKVDKFITKIIMFVGNNFQNRITQIECNDVYMLTKTILIIVSPNHTKHISIKLYQLYRQSSSKHMRFKLVVFVYIILSIILNDMVMIYMQCNMHMHMLSISFFSFELSKFKPVDTCIVWREHVSCRVLLNVFTVLSLIQKLWHKYHTTIWIRST